MMSDLTENNLREYPTPLEASSALDVNIRIFCSFIEKIGIRECVQRTGGKKTNIT
jgi:hypothetical protein